MSLNMGQIFIVPFVHHQILHYYLVDDTVEIREVHKPNDGRDPFPVLICRQKLAKNRDNVECKYIEDLGYPSFLIQLICFIQ